MLTPGYWHSTYWPDDYWHDTYWQHHGAGGLPTDNMHLIGANLSMVPSWLPDANTNTLFEGSIEAKEAVYTTNLHLGGIDTTVSRASAGDINIEGKLVYRADGTDVPVGDGGTGLSNPTDHSLLLGSGASALTQLGVATNGKIPIGSTGADPVLAEIAGTANQVTSTPGAGTITLSTPQDIHTGASAVFNDATFLKIKLTPIGGLAIALTNNTGANSIEGQLVETDDTDENSYKAADADASDVIGVVYNAGVADGSEVWIVVSGIAEVLLDAGGCVHHDRLVSSSTAGSADVSNAPAVAVHFQEIGHAIETVVGAGLAKAVLHFN